MQPYSDAAEAANTNATITVRGKTGLFTIISDVTFSYSAAPTAGRLLISGTESNKSYDIDVTSAGAQSLAWGEEGLTFQQGEDVALTLFAGGAAIVGKLNCGAIWRSTSQLVDGNSQ